MDEYKPNSHKSKEDYKASANEEKKIEKVIKGNAKPRKKSEISKFADVFISEDIGNVKSYALNDVLIPAIKKAVTDIVKNGIDMIVYGGTGKGQGSSTPKVSYRKYYDDRDDRRYSQDKPSIRNRFDYDDILFESRGDAEAVLMQMQEVVETYGLVTVSDMYDMAYLTAPYTSNRYGWTNVRVADIVRVRDGYVIKLPRAMPID